MLSTMREKTKVIMLVLLVAFVGWLIFDVGMGLQGQGQVSTQDVGSVNGRPIRYQQWAEAYRALSEQVRAQNPGTIFTREEQQELETQAFESLVQAELMREEYRRRGITVSDQEIVDLVRRLPPPEVQQSPDFQTDGQFDQAKYERFIASNNEQAEQYRLALEARYREELPRYKLLQSVTSDVYVSDAKLWQLWRDTRESLTVRALVIRPSADVPDSMARVTDQEARAYYDAHREEIRRPARAVMSFISMSKLPTTVDSVYITRRLVALRDSINAGQVTFERAAEAVSLDTASASNGGQVTLVRGAGNPVAFERAAFSLPVGRVSDPVYSTMGTHLIKVERRSGDSVTLRHIVLPHARYGERLDSLEARADSLDRLAAEQDDGSMLDTAAARLGLTIEQAPPMYEGVPYVIGRYRIPDVSVWAFTEGRPGQTSPVAENNAAYYVFRLDSLYEGGIPRFEDVINEARAAATIEKKKTVARQLAQEAERRLAAGRSMDQVAQEMGFEVQTIGPFTRTGQVPVLGVATPAIGAAFRLRMGERSGVLEGSDALFFLQPTARTTVDSTAWAAQKDQQRAQVIQLVRRARAQMYVEALRRAADVEDNRQEIMRANAEAAAAPETQTRN